MMTTDNSGGDGSRADKDNKEEVKPPRSWVEELFDNEEAVRCLLDEARQAHLCGAYEDARLTLGGFAESEPGMFQVIALGVIDIEQFYRDLDEQYSDGEAPINELKTFCGRYTRLVDEIQVTLAEQFQGAHNPDPRVGSRFRYSRSQHPLMEYRIFSGDVELCEFVHYPSQGLLLAAQIVDTVVDFLECVDRNQDDLALFELDRLARSYQRLYEQVERTEAFVDTTSIGTDKQASSVDVEDDEDWSFY